MADNDLLLTISFANSTSPNLKKALKIANSFETFSPADLNSKLNTLELDLEQIRKRHKDIKSLCNLISTWASTTIMVNGELVDREGLYKLDSILSCNADYQRAVLQTEHCRLSEESEGWGCKHLTTIRRNTNDYPRYYYRESRKAWYQFGEFASDKVWKVDKEQIRNVLKREIDLKFLRLCSAFDYSKVEQMIEALPSEINLDESKEYEIEYEESEAGNAISRKVVGIKLKSEESYSPFSRGGLSFGLSLNLGSDEDDEEEEDLPQEKKRFIPNVTFEDIGGIDHIITTIREVIELPLKRPDIFQHLGIKPHKGILLYGPPGCGKTMIAKAISNEIKAHFISIKGPELLNKYVGQSEENLRKIFDEASEFQPSIIFFDEIDSIARSRTSNEANQHSDQFLNQLLTLMDGIEDYGRICIIASTNRRELMDEAILRPGRFDYSIEITKPTREGCYQILKIAAQKMPLAENLDLKPIAESLFGFSGAEIAFVAREAAYSCLRRNVDFSEIFRTGDFEGINNEKLVVNKGDFLYAISRLSEVSSRN